MYHTLGSKRRFGLSSGLSKPFENPMLNRPNDDRRPDLVLKAIDTNVKTDSSPQKKKSYQKPAASPPSAQEPPRSGPRSALDSLSESSLLLSLPTTKPASLPPLESNDEDTPAVLSLLACPPTANKMAYFMSLTTTATSDEYLRFLLAISNGKVSVLEQMIVETAAWHLDRCDGHMNLLGFIQQFFQCRLFKKLPDIMTPAQLRIQYYNDYTTEIEDSSKSAFASSSNFTPCQHSSYWCCWPVLQVWRRELFIIQESYTTDLYRGRIWLGKV